MIFVAAYAIVAQKFPDNVGAMLGLLETFIGLGLIIGPVVGGLLYEV